jgi:hypothetical protein
MYRQPRPATISGEEDGLDLYCDSTWRVMHIPMEIGFVQRLAPFLHADEKIDAARPNHTRRPRPCCRYELMSFSDRTHR